MLLASGGVAVLAAAGGALAWALSGSDKATPKALPSTTPTAPASGSGSAPPRMPGVAPQPLWTYKLAGSNLSEAVLCSNGLVFLGGDGLYAVQLGNGTERFAKPDAAARYLALGGGVVSYGMITDLITSDAATGSVLWKYDPRTPKGATEQIVPDNVLAADDKLIYATCSFLPLDANGFPESSAAATPGVMALDLKTGAVVWSQRRKAKADNFVNSLLSAGTLLYTDSQKNLVARSTKDGSQLWFAETDNRGSYYQPVADGERVYCSSAGSGFQAVNIAGGTQAWAKKPDAGSKYWYSPIAVGDGVVYSVLGGQSFSFPNGPSYSPATPPTLFAYRASDGTELWRLELPDEASMAVSPVLVGTTLFVATPNKGIHAVDTKTHKVIWTFQNGLTETGDWKFGTDGKILVAVQDEHVYALPAV